MTTTKYRTARVVSLIALAFSTASAQASIIDLAWDAHGRMERELVVPPGKFAEVCGRLNTSDVVQWRFEAVEALDFNIHFHEGEKVTYPERQDDTREMSGTFSSQAEHDYCWMWRNRGTRPVAMTFQLTR